MTTNGQYSVKLLIRNADGGHLVLQRSQISHANPGEWELPGGKIDKDETPEEAAMREVLEETGLKIKVTGLMGYMEYILEDHKINYTILPAKLVTDKITLSEEHSAYDWFPLNEFKNHKLLNRFLPILDSYRPG